VTAELAPEEPPDCPPEETRELVDRFVALDTPEEVTLVAPPPVSLAEDAETPGPLGLLKLAEELELELDELPEVSALTVAVDEPPLLREL
jgi:hypothetical protein